jgi:hypothetical protein
MLVLLPILHCLAPYLEELIGKDRSPALTWAYLRTCSADLDAVITLPVHVDYNRNICWSLHVYGKPVGSSSITYTINKHRVSYWSDSSVFVSWAQNHFRIVSDRTYCRPVGAPPEVRLKPSLPVPKMKSKQIPLPTPLTLTVMSLHSIIEVDVMSNDFPEDVKDKIQKLTQIVPGRQTLFLHGDTDLIPLTDQRPLYDYNITQSDTLIMHVSQHSWEDSDNEPPMEMNYESDKKDKWHQKVDELRDILDSVEISQLEDKLKLSKQKYLEARFECQKDLAQLRDYEQKIAKRKKSSSSSSSSRTQQRQ